jgi:hypothetical protein
MEEAIKNRIIEEYESQQRLPLKKREMLKSDGEFIKVGLRIKKSDLEIFGVGRAIAIGERDWIVESILKNKDVKKRPLDRKNVLKTILENIDYQGNSLMFISTELYGSLLSENPSLIKFDNRWNKILNSCLVPIPDKQLKGIIMVEENALILKTIKNKTELIIKEGTDNTWEIFTLNKLMMFPEGIKILD